MRVEAIWGAAVPIGSADGVIISARLLGVRWLTSANAPEGIVVLSDLAVSIGRFMVCQVY